MKKEDIIKLLIKIVPIVLIILILIITLLVNTSRKKATKEDLQQDIKEYAEENINASTPVPNPAVTEDAKATATATASPTAEPTAEPSATPYKEVMEKGTVDYSKVKFNTDEQLPEIMGYWEEGNEHAMDDLAHLDRYIAMSYSLKGTKNYYYSGDKNGSGLPNGQGIAVYADNQYYYGSWKNGVRQGEGKWIHYHIHPGKKVTDTISYHQFTGTFSNDLPNGEGSEHYEYLYDNLNSDEKYRNNLIGHYVDGLIDGEMYITTIDKDQNVVEWNAVAEKGKFKAYVDGKKNNNIAAMINCKDDSDYIWIYNKDNKNIGVTCYISEKKN